MAYCAVLRDSDGNIQKVVKEDGTESQLFNTIVKHPLVKSGEDALAIFKNKFSKVIEGTYKDIVKERYKEALYNYRMARKVAAKELEAGNLTQEQHDKQIKDLNKELGRVQKKLGVSSKDFNTAARDVKWDKKTKEALPESNFKNGEEILNALQGETWAMLTAENPMAMQVTDIENYDNNERAAVWLRSKGYNPQPIFGKYGNSENSFFVANLTREDAIEFAKEFNQESVATNEGLVYQDGSYNPKVGQEVGVEQDDFYSTMSTAQGLVDFTVQYDFDTLENQAVENEADVKNSLINLDKPNIILTFANNEEIVASSNPLQFKKEQDAIQDELEDLNNFVNCLWQ